jgi:ABC-type sulfate/molybdate transport systems ATPase subunit
MVTHDVDEALLLSDRIVMMTSGPAARVGQILEVPFARPRTRHELMEDPRYYALREQLIAFLESQDHRHAAPAPAPAVAPPEASAKKPGFTVAPPPQLVGTK